MSSSKILLTSSGFRNPISRKSIIENLPSKESRKVCYITTAAKVVRNPDYVSIDKHFMIEGGFKVTEFDLAERDRVAMEDFLEFDVIHVQGGNGFYLLKHIFNTGFDKVLPDLLDRGLTYIGKSAGSYILCPTIEMHTWTPKDWRRFGITDLTALNIVPFLVSAHYSKEKAPYVQAGAKKSKYPTWAITNEQIIVYENGVSKLVGPGDKYCFGKD